MDKPNFRDKCYQTKDDKIHNTIFTKADLSQETADEREERLKNIRASRGRWVRDEKTGEIVRAEDYYAKKHEVNAPSVSMWNPEWSVLATGQRMSKGELRAYCKAHGKEIVG